MKPRHYIAIATDRYDCPRAFGCALTLDKALDDCKANGYVYLAQSVTCHELTITLVASPDTKRGSLRIRKRR